MRPACHCDRLVASLRLRLRVCTMPAVLNLLGTLLVLALVLARHEKEHR
jgi:hypothetical protein